MEYDWKKTVLKVGKQLVYIFIAGLASTYANNPYYLAIAPAIVGLENYLKHRKD
jgi:hypothetical protein